MNRSLIFQLHAAKIDRELGEISVYGKCFRVPQFPLKGDVPVRNAVSIEVVLVQRRKEVRIEIDVPDGDFPIERKWIVKTERDSTADGAFTHRRPEVELCHLPV